MTNKSNDHSTQLRLRFEAIYNGSAVDTSTQSAINDKIREEYSLPQASIGTPIPYTVPKGARTILDGTPLMLWIHNRDNSHFILQATYLYSVATDLREINRNNIVSREQFREECDLEQGYSDSLAYGYLYLELDKGGSIVTGTTIKHDGKEIDLLLHIEWPENDSLEEVADREDEEPYTYTGSKNIAKLMESAIKKQEWKDPFCLPLSDYPLNPVELGTLYDLSVRNTTLKVALVRLEGETIEDYMELDADDFPKKLGEKLLEDDKDGNLDDIVELIISAQGKIDGDNFSMKRSFRLPDNEVTLMKSQKKESKPAWDICSVCIDWRADRHCESHVKKFARPGTDAANRHPSIVAGERLSLSGMPMVGEWGGLFSSINVKEFDDEGMTIRYGEGEQRIKVGKWVMLETNGMNYTTFWLQIRLDNDTEESESIEEEAEPNPKRAKDNLFNIENNILKYCEVNNPTVIVPDGVTTIAEGAFLKPNNKKHGQETLQQVVLPESVTTIEEKAFFNCENLESVTISGTATLGSKAFWGCTRLYDVTLADGVNSIGEECFGFCSNLLSLYIPSSVETMGGYIASQHSNDSTRPVIFCHRDAPAEGWHKNWNVICKNDSEDDPLIITNPPSRHTTVYGITRSGFMRESVEWAVPAKPDHLPAPPQNGDDMEERCNQAEQLIANHEWHKAFDLLYLPQFPSDKRHRRLLELFYNKEAINRLRVDQVERFREESMEGNSPTACFFYGSWLQWNATHIEQWMELERCATTAARAGYGDMWMLLRYMWKSGQNVGVRTDEAKAAQFGDNARQTDSEVAFRILTLVPLLAENPKEAMEAVEQRIAEEGGIEKASPRMLTMLGQCHLELGDNTKAKEFARMAIKKGDIDRAYQMLIDATCDIDELFSNAESQAILEEGCENGSPYCLCLNGYETEQHAKEESDPKRKQELSHNARLMLEKAALLGNDSACFFLVLSVNNGETSFNYGRELDERSVDCYPYLLHGAMVGDRDCAYWLYRFQESAFDSETDYSEKEFNLPYSADHSSPDVWRRYAQAIYQLYDEPWPEEDDDSEDGYEDEENDIEDLTDPMPNNNQEATYDMENEFKIIDNALVHCKVNNPKVIIPDGVTSICSYAFSKPDDFHGQDTLESVVVPESVVSIEEGAFKYCKNLKKVTILGAATIGWEAFLSCSSLEEVYLSDEVKSIGSKCFAFCEKLKYLYIPKGVTHIGWDIAGMNDSSYRDPVFHCYRKGNGTDWDDDWNRMYNDPRFGNDRRYHYFHPTYYGVNRDGTPRQGCELVHTPCTDMPHGTGQKATENKSRAESRRIPKAKLKLWLTATIISMVGEKEYLLDDEEREMLPHMLRDNDEHIEHQLDEPWEITIDDSTGHLAPELKISAWINNFDDVFDGKTIVVHHDMPWHNDPYSEYPVSMLTMGETVIAEKHLTFGITTYDVRLHIQWVEEEYKTYTKQEALADIQQSMASCKNLKDSDYEIDVSLAHGHWKAEQYKTYKPSVFLTQFPADLDAESDKWSDLGQIVIQPYLLYEETHSYSDDYRDAAEAYGEDCDDWTTTERHKTGDCVTYEISEA